MNIITTLICELQAIQNMLRVYVKTGEPLRIVYIFTPGGGPAEKLHDVSAPSAGDYTLGFAPVFSTGAKQLTGVRATFYSTEYC